MAFVLLALLTALAALPAHAQPGPGAQVRWSRRWRQSGQRRSDQCGLVNAIGLQIMVLASARKAFRR